MYYMSCPNNCDPYPMVINWEDNKYSIKCPSCGLSTKRCRTLRAAEKEWNRIAYNGVGVSK